MIHAMLKGSVNPNVPPPTFVDVRTIVTRYKGMASVAHIKQRTLIVLVAHYDTYRRRSKIIDFSVVVLFCDPLKKRRHVLSYVTGASSSILTNQLMDRIDDGFGSPLIVSVASSSLDDSYAKCVRFIKECVEQTGSTQAAYASFMVTTARSREIGQPSSSSSFTPSPPKRDHYRHIFNDVDNADDDDDDHDDDDEKDSIIDTETSSDSDD